MFFVTSICTLNIFVTAGGAHSIFGQFLLSLIDNTQQLFIEIWRFTMQQSVEEHGILKTTNNMYDFIYYAKPNKRSFVVFVSVGLRYFFEKCFQM